MRRAVFQNRMALDMINALQLGICAIVQTKSCVFIPEESVDVSSLLNHMRTQVNSLSDPTHSLGDLAINCLDHGTLSRKTKQNKTITLFWNLYHDLHFLLYVPLLMLWYLPPAQPDSHQTSHLHVGETC